MLCLRIKLSTFQLWASPGVTAAGIEGWVGKSHGALHEEEREEGNHQSKSPWPQTEQSPGGHQRRAAAAEMGSWQSQ